MISLGILYAFAAAVIFSISAIINRKAVLGREITAGMFISVAIGVPLILPVIILNGDLFTLTSIAPFTMLLLALMGFFQFVGGRGLNMAAIKLIGATRSSPFRETSLIHSAVWGVVLLSEEVSILAALAILMISAGAIITSVSGEPATVERARTFGRSILLRGALYGLLGAAFWGFTPVLIRAALPGISSPLFAVWIAFIFATIMWTAIITGTRKFGTIRNLDRNGAFLFLLGGATVVLAQIFRFNALNLEQIVLVVPILFGLDPLLTLLFSTLLIRKLEGINRLVILGVAASTLGAIGIASGL
ncbi:MAG: EamA family transporter [Nitrososphaerales archaeon]